MKWALFLEPVTYMYIIPKNKNIIILIDERTKRARHYQGCTNSRFVNINAYMDLVVWARIEIKKTFDDSLTGLSW